MMKTLEETHSKFKDLHPKYKKLMNEKYKRSSWNWQKQLISFLSRIPPPDELTKDYVLWFLDQPSQRDGRPLSNDSVVQYIIKFNIVAKYFKLEGLLEGIEKPKRRRLKEDDIISEKEAAELIASSHDERARALIHLCLDAGLRIDEALSMRLEDITIWGTETRVLDILNSKTRAKAGVKWRLVTRRSKTEIRPVPAYQSITSLLSWLKMHPMRREKKGPLFVGKQRVRDKTGRLVWKEMSYNAAFNDITKAYVRAGYRDARELRNLTKMKKWRESMDEGEVVHPRHDEERKLLNRLLELQLTVKQLDELITEQKARPPIVDRRIHTFRHRVGSRYGKSNMGQDLMNTLMGWTPGSSQSSVYVHFNEEDLGDEYDRVHGLQTRPKPTVIDSQSWECPRCGILNPPDVGVCDSCPSEQGELESKIEQLQTEIETLKTQRSEDLGKLALELLEKLKEKEKEKAQG